MPPGGSTAMMHWESADNVWQYVRDFELQTGRAAKPFRLEVDFVYAGLGTVVEVGEEYAIMPLRSHVENKSWWMQTLHEIG